MKTRAYMGALVIMECLIGGPAGAWAGTATWVGEELDDRWLNPANWQGGVLPTAADDIVFADVIWHEHPELHTTVTIDAYAVAHDLSFYQYGKTPRPFSDIKVLPGAHFVLNEEKIDQTNVNAYNGYSLSGGLHEVAADLTYTSKGGHFQMTGGTLRVGGTFSPYPEAGWVTITGGEIEADTLMFSAWSNSYAIGAGATLRARDELYVGGGLYSRTLVLACPVHMEGADFVNDFHSGWARQVDLTGANLIFEGGSGATSMFEVAGNDLGADLAAFSDNFTLGLLTLGGSDVGMVQLVDNIDNNRSYSSDEVLYLHDVQIGLSSLLDLNGRDVFALYSVTLDGVTYTSDQGYREFLPGDYTALTDTLGGGVVILMPDPSALALLALGGLAIRARRASRHSVRPH